MTKIEQQALELHKKLVGYYTGKTGENDYLEYPVGHHLVQLALLEAERTLCKELKEEL